MDKTRIGGFLDTVTTGMRLMLSQELVDADRDLPLVHLNAEVFIELPVGRRFIAHFQQLLIIYIFYIHDSGSKL
jgi:hypothetical protein